MYLVYRLYISYLINIIGTILSILGSILISIGTYKLGFELYIIADFLLVVLFTGVVRKYWKFDTAAMFQVILYTIFMCIAIVGYMRVF